MSALFSYGSPFALHKKKISNLILLDQRLPKGLRWIPKIGLFIGFTKQRARVVVCHRAIMHSAQTPPNRKASQKSAFYLRSLMRFISAIK
jgi:hypothetical protein